MQEKKISYRRGKYILTEEKLNEWKQKLIDSGVFRSNGNLSPHWVKNIAPTMDLDEIPGRSPQEKAYVIFKNKGEISKCKICGNLAVFRNYTKGYSKTCSPECKKIIDLRNLDKVDRSISSKRKTDLSGSSSAPKEKLIKKIKKFNLHNLYLLNIQLSIKII